MPNLLSLKYVAYMITFHIKKLHGNRVAIDGRTSNEDSSGNKVFKKFFGYPDYQPIPFPWRVGS